MFRPLRRQNPFAHEEKVGKKEYVPSRVLHVSTGRFGSEVNENIQRHPHFTGICQTWCFDLQFCFLRVYHVGLCLVEMVRSYLTLGFIVNKSSVFAVDTRLSMSAIATGGVGPELRSIDVAAVV